MIAIIANDPDIGSLHCNDSLASRLEFLAVVGHTGASAGIKLSRELEVCKGQWLQMECFATDNHPHTPPNC